MKVLIVGGTGLIGGEAAMHLQQQGHDVTIMARKPSAAPGLAAMDFMQCDYANDDCSDGRLQGFDWLVFSAAADIRNLPRDGSVTPEAFYRKYNDEAVPEFFRAARNAGITRAVYIGTFYPQVAPQQIGVCPYVTSRHNTDVSLRALSTEQFNVCSLNAPFVLGHIPGLVVPHIDALVSYARGNMPEMPIFAPRGGTNHITSRSLAQAVGNALLRGESGKPYLIGDENLSWKQFLEAWFSAVGNPQDLAVTDDEHPLFPNVILFAGAGATVSYEPPADEVALLGYERGCIAAMIDEIIAL